MKPKWIIEHVFDDDTQNLVDSLEETGTEYKILSSVYEGQWDIYGPKECVVTYGSIQFGHIVQRETQWVPGHICTDRHYLCSYYYPHFKRMLNDEYLFLPLAALLDKKDFVFDTLGADDAVFVRPDSGNKTFTGALCYRERFDYDLRLMTTYDPPPETMCLISTPKNVEKEWRFFVVNGRILCGSQYKPGRHNIVGTSIHDDGHVAWRVAEQAVEQADWEPDYAWCIDICKVASGSYYVLEIGSFSSAGLYECSTRMLVEEINKAALAEWKEIYEI